MKKIVREKTFAKHYASRIATNTKLIKQFEDRFKLFMNGKKGRPVNDHALTGDKNGFRAFSISGDIRVVYIETADSYILVDVGTHNQVY